MSRSRLGGVWGERRTSLEASPWVCISPAVHSLCSCLEDAGVPRTRSPEGRGPLTGGCGISFSLPPSPGSTERVLCLQVSYQDVLNLGLLLPSLAFSCTGDTEGSYSSENEGGKLIHRVVGGRQCRASVQTLAPSTQEWKIGEWAAASGAVERNAISGGSVWRFPARCSRRPRRRSVRCGTPQKQNMFT